MVQVIENHADVEGQVVAVQSEPARPNQTLVTMTIGSSKSVGSFPNLFADYAGRQLSVFMPADIATNLKVGATIHCRIRRAGPNVVMGDRCSED